MSLKVRKLRFGFGFYLTISALIHVLAFLFISFSPIRKPAPKPREVVPAKVQFQKPAREPRVGGAQSELMSMNGPLSTGGERRRIREATGLPSHMRHAPAPDAYRKSTMTRYVQLPDPDQLSDEFQPPTTSGLPESIRKINVNIGSMKTIGRIPTVGSSDTGTGKKMLGLGETDSDTEASRSLRSRPSFPYSKARPHLPKTNTSVKFKIRIDRSGAVRSVKPLEGTADDPLIGVLRNWLRQWKYESGSGSVTQPVTIRIPGE